MSFRSIAALTASALMLALPLAAQAQTTVQPVEPVAGQPAEPTGGAITPPSGAPGQPASPTVIEPTETTPAPSSGDKPLSKAQDRGLAWLTIGLIALAAVLLGALIVILLWRLRGWDPRWLKRWRHATAESGWRVGLSGAEIRDFIRIGR